MVYGYTRVSSKNQNNFEQLDALKKFGCEKIYQENSTSPRRERPEFQKLISGLSIKDTVVVWTVDRLGATTLELLRLMTQLRDKKIRFISLKQKIDTGIDSKNPWYFVCAALFQNERELALERTKTGLESARSRGKNGGRPQGIPEKNKGKAIKAALLYNEGEKSIKEIMVVLEIKSKATLYSYLRNEGVQIKGWEIGDKKDKIVISEPVNKTKAPKTALGKGLRSLLENNNVDSGITIIKKKNNKQSKLKTTPKKPLGKNKIISVSDGKRMIGVGAECSTEIINQNGKKNLEIFKTLPAATKKKKETSSTGYIWIWNKDENEWYIVVDEKMNPI